MEIDFWINLLGTTIPAWIGLVGGIPMIYRRIKERREKRPDLRVERIKGFFMRTVAVNKLDENTVSRVVYIGLSFAFKNYGNLMATNARCIWVLSRKDNGLQVIDSKVASQFKEDLSMVGSGSTVERSAFEIMVDSKILYEMQIKLSCSEKDFDTVRMPLQIEGIPT
jgi:hypothetical protein